MQETPEPIEFLWRRPRSFFTVLVAVVSNPRQSFAAMPRQAGPLPPLLFLLMAQLIPAVIMTLWALASKGSAPLGETGLAILQAIANSVIASAIFFLVGRYGFRAKLGFTATLRVVSYSSGIMVISPLRELLSPWAGGFMMLAMVLVVIYLIQAGLQVVGDMPIWQALISVLLSLVLFMVLMMGVRMLSGSPPPAGPPAAPGVEAPLQTPAKP